MFDAMFLNKCDIVDIIGESQRFLIHISLVHILSCIMDSKEEFVSSQFLRTLLSTAIAICIYHIFMKKNIEPKLKNLRNKCKDTRYRKDGKRSSS